VLVNFKSPAYAIPPPGRYSRKPILTNYLLQHRCFATHTSRTRTLPSHLRRLEKKPFAKGAVREHNSARSIHERVRGVFQSAKSLRNISDGHRKLIIVNARREWPS
jgi:hypothetical protein